MFLRATVVLVLVVVLATSALAQINGQVASMKTPPVSTRFQPTSRQAVRNKATISPIEGRSTDPRLFLLLDSHGDDLPAGYKIVEGDIVVPADQGGVAATYNINLWPRGIVPYEFDASVTIPHRNAMRFAMEQWEGAANIHFLPRTNQTNYVHIQNSTANNSVVGMNVGRQIINIQGWDYIFLMAHELGHALGLWHEQSRVDRDDFIQVNTWNIQPGYENNFFIEPASKHFGPYDFDSVMHYDACAFSICCPPGHTCACADGCETITVLPPNESMQWEIGQLDHLSNGDKAAMGFLYPGGSIVAWGDNSDGQINVPAPNIGFVAVAAGDFHSLGLKSDGSIAAWGCAGPNDLGQCDVLEPNGDFVAIAAGSEHSLGIKVDSSVVGWGRNDEGEITIPPPNYGFVSVAAGGFHSLGLKFDGSIAAWGDNSQSQCDVPLPNSGFIAIAAAGDHSVGLKADGSIVAWGDNSGFALPVPNSGFIGIAAGGGHGLGLNISGHIIPWGDNSHGQANFPSSNTNFIGIAAGIEHSLGLKNSGSVIAWGYNIDGQISVPPPNGDFVAVAAGGSHSLALKDGHAAIDIQLFAVCFAGPAAVPAPPQPITSGDCLSNFDAVRSGHIDLADFAVLQLLLVSQ